MQVVAFDFETYLITDTVRAPRAVCLSWATGDASGIVVGQSEMEMWLDEHISNEVLLVGHYVAFDILVALANFPRLWPKIWARLDKYIACTMCAEKLLDIAEGKFRTAQGKSTEYALSDLSFRYFGNKLDKGESTWRKRYAELDGVPVGQWPKEAVEYSMADASATLAVFYRQGERANKIKYKLPTCYDEVRADVALALMSARGVRVDVDRVAELRTEVRDESYRLARILASHGLITLVQNDDLFTKKATWSTKKKLSTIRETISKYYPGDLPRTEKGAISTEADVLAACNRDELRDLAHFTTLEKIESTYLSHMNVPEIHARFTAIGAASDRTSCSQPNLQNPPRAVGVRECFIPRDGYVFLSCDFDSQEMRTFAQSCIDIGAKSRLAQCYREDPHFDPHLELAAGLLNISVVEAKKRYLAGDAVVKEKRQQAKVCNFGFPGGLGAETFVEFAKEWGININEKQASDMRTSWRQHWPETATFFPYCSALADGDLEIKRSGFRRGLVRYTAACNGHFQTLAAHASKSALWEVTRRCFNDITSYLYGSRPVLFLHDEIILETPEEAGHEAAKELEETMIKAMAGWTPDVPPAASSVLMRRWSKRAERVEDPKTGRLIPWEP